MASDTRSMAVFCDFENVALGVRDAKYDKFDIRPVLERLLLKGSIVVKKAYCDWDRYKGFKAALHEANFELIEIPHVRQSGKNSADIRLVVDALDLCYTKAHVDTFVIISGDSDFSPLVSKLRENAKQVIGVGVKQSTSDLLVANCDEFIFYDELVRDTLGRDFQRQQARRESREGQSGSTAAGASAGVSASGALAAGGVSAAGNMGGAGAASGAGSSGKSEERARRDDLEQRRAAGVELAVATFEALMAERGDSGKIWASVLKEAIKRRKPDFSEGRYGFKAFGNLLEAAQKRGLLAFGRDDKSGAYVYRAAQSEDTTEGAVDSAAEGLVNVGAEVVAGNNPQTAAEDKPIQKGSRRASRHKKGSGVVSEHETGSETTAGLAVHNRGSRQLTGDDGTPAEIREQTEAPKPRKRASRRSPKSSSPQAADQPNSTPQRSELAPSQPGSTSQGPEPATTQPGLTSHRSESADTQASSPSTIESEVTSPKKPRTRRTPARSAKKTAVPPTGIEPVSSA